MGGAAAALRRPDCAGQDADVRPELAGAAEGFAFTNADFERVRAMIHRAAGISLSGSKRSMVYSRLCRRLRALGLGSFDEYLSGLDDPDNTEWELFVNALTTNLTSFFRERHHFPILADFLRARVREGPLRIWCSASSTGEEPYSIAITACQAFGNLRPPVEIVASDIDTAVLATAERGVYSDERIRDLPESDLRRHFLRGTGSNAGFVRVKPELRRLVSFTQINLLERSWALKGPFDAIFCRNVMIYFDKSTQHAILERFHPLLADDGLFFAGHSENFIHARDLFELQGKTVYTKARRPR